MAIKDKNGNVYKLRGPNPLLQKQKEWDRSKLHFHNMKGWKSEVVGDERNPVEEFNANVIDIGNELGLVPNKEVKTKAVDAQDFVQELQHPPQPEKTVTLTVDQRTARLLKDRGVAYHCAPAVERRVHKDSLYDEEYHTIVYGEKFIFDAIVIDQSDLELMFWCVRPITKDSIVYRKLREGGERWWRVKEVEEKTGGYVVLAMPSDSNPDFS